MSELIEIIELMSSPAIEIIEVAPVAVAGAAGVSVTTAEVRGSNLWVVLSNGQEIDCGEVVGSDGIDGIDGIDGQDSDVPGPSGAPGVGIVSASVDGAGMLQIVLSDGQTVSVGPIIGPAGPAGQDAVGGMTELADDLSPALGGDLSLNGFTLDGLKIDQTGYGTHTVHLSAPKVGGSEVRSLVIAADGFTVNALGDGAGPGYVGLTGTIVEVGGNSESVSIGVGALSVNIGDRLVTGGDGSLSVTFAALYESRLDSDLNANGMTVSGLKAPVAGSDAATRAWTEAQIAAIPASTGGLTQVSDDTSPQLGGDLDLNDKKLGWLKVERTVYGPSQGVVSIKAPTTGGYNDGILFDTDSFTVYAQGGAAGASTGNIYLDGSGQIDIGTSGTSISVNIGADGGAPFNIASRLFTNQATGGAVLYAGELQNCSLASDLYTNGSKVGGLKIDQTGATGGNVSVMAMNFANTARADLNLGAQQIVFDVLGDLNLDCSGNAYLGTNAQMTEIASGGGYFNIGNVLTKDQSIIALNGTELYGCSLGNDLNTNGRSIEGLRIHQMGGQVSVHALAADESGPEALVLGGSNVSVNAGGGVEPGSISLSADTLSLGFGASSLDLASTAASYIIGDVLIKDYNTGQTTLSFTQLYDCSLRSDFVPSQPEHVASKAYCDSLAPQNWSASSVAGTPVRLTTAAGGTYTTAATGKVQHFEMLVSGASADGTVYGSFKFEGIFRNAGSYSVTTATTIIGRSSTGVTATVDADVNGLFVLVDGPSNMTWKGIVTLRGVN